MDGLVRTGRWGVLFAAACLVATATAAQEVAGTVHNQQHDPVSGVVLRWIDPQGQATETLTDGEGHYRVSLSPSTVVGPTETLAPGRYALGQNYPNPFNPGTVIPF